MSNVLEKPTRQAPAPRLTLHALQKELAALNRRVEDLEDLRELNQAIERQGAKPLTPWREAKKALGLV